LHENCAQKRFYASKTESALTPMGHAPTSDAGTAFDGLWEFELTWPEPHDYLKGKRRFKSDLIPAPILVRG
jgi:hypothetical protein